MHGQQSGGAILAHAGEQHAKRTLTRSLGHRMEQHIDRRYIQAICGLRNEFKHKPHASRLHPQIRMSRRQISAAGLHMLAAARFDNVQRSLLRQARSEARDKIALHMLRNHNGRRFFRFISKIKPDRQLGCRAGLVVAVTGVEVSQVQFAVDQMIQRGLVSMGLSRAMGGSNMNFTFDTCYSIGFTAECAYGIELLFRRLR